MRDFHLAGRSPVFATEGMAVTSHPHATFVAVETLRSGGNAVDAAMAAAALLSVVEPQSMGIGGDCFALYAPAAGGVIAYNGSGRAPNAAVPDWYLERNIPTVVPESAHAVTVPGAVDAWARLVEDHGTKGLDAVLQPAINAARNGYVVQQRIAWDWQRHLPRLSKDPNTSDVFLVNGLAPSEGSVHRQPKLATTLERIADLGREGFYDGPVAEDIVQYLAGLGGLHRMEDFALHKGEYVAPITSCYKGLDVYECPPNSQGVIALLMFNILAGFDFAGWDPNGADRLHLEIEASRLARLERDTHLADPECVDVPVARLLSVEYAASLRTRICSDRVLEDHEPALAPAPRNTAHLCVVDRDGNAISLISSVFEYFGSCLCTPASGVLLNNRGSAFVLDPAHPNCIGPRKRPLHSIIPALAMQNGRVVMPFGVMGGDYQPLGQAHVLMNMMEYGMDPQQAIDQPRAFHEKGVLRVENGVRADVVASLEARGHRVERADEPYGGAQAIWIDHDRGVLVGGADPRLDGCAIGY